MEADKENIEEIEKDLTPPKMTQDQMIQAHQLAEVKIATQEGIQNLKIVNQIHQEKVDLY